MAFRAGAEVSDMEFIQFHPTVLYMKKVPRFLLSEALRSEGAYLRNIELDRFMEKYHPLAEQAPGDVVARAIMHEMEVSRAKDPFVYLDLTHLNAARVQKRFPRIYATCMKHNIDITEDVIPVRPAAHFSIGGVRTDSEWQDESCRALRRRRSGCDRRARREPARQQFAAGGPGVWSARGKGHARRTEAGAQACGETKESRVTERARGCGHRRTDRPDPGHHVEGCRHRAHAEWDAGGDSECLRGLRREWRHPRTRRTHEAANLHLAGLLVARSALAREESRGAHYRIDCPGHDDKKFLKHSVVKGESVRFV